MDFNPAVDHYRNGGGITFLMPGAAPEQATALTTRHRVLKEVIANMKPHASKRSVCDLLRERLEPLGYRNNFVPYVSGERGVGHSLGVDVVEPPHLSATSDFSATAGDDARY